MFQDDKNENLPSIIDLFSGCGGFSQGFLKSGFEVVAASEIWDPAIETYKHNHPETPVVNGDIKLPEIKNQLYDIIGNKKINVVIGGPPCQGYSIAGNRNPEDPRGQLYLDFVEIVERIQPDFFVMENVKGVLHMKHVSPDLSSKELGLFQDNCAKLKRYKDLKRYGAQRELNMEETREFDDLKRNHLKIKNQVDSKMVPLIEKILARFKAINYKVKWKVLNSADYGVPQTRERIIFIGTRHENIDFTFPKPTHHENKISVLGKQNSWVNSGEILKKYEAWNEDSSLNHDFTRHSEKFLKKLNATPVGKAVYKNYSDAWWRLDPDKPAKTVKENHGGVFVHYKFDRVLSPRELAALQSFNDSFRFKGTKSSVLKQIGNAVPPLLSLALANHLKTCLKNL
ncbi:MAG: DNA cytosine methyltransferase [Candidatus Lokiarchaeota archaeon]|nr:DNA cytosine methyltransferase [Candidatus Lokiarchaeota archaeon]